ncbi:MAG: GNAT family N-acetyltransferase [Myxacorys californica WJT36-NPBG1]|nr:GNAT family N-acetyltransferase [Myxacorys californica WJT36-NPBG1]
MNISHQQDLPESFSEAHYLVRAIRQQDLFEAAGVLADSFPLNPEFLRWLIPVMRIGIYEDLRSRLRTASPHYACLVAVDMSRSSGTEEDCLVGTVEVGLRNESPWPIRTNHYPYLSNLAVREDYRGRGIAKKLLATCDRIVTGWGFQEIYLHVLETNNSARQLYLKAGYQVEETQSGWSSFLFGQPQRMLLHKKLEKRTNV